MVSFQSDQIISPCKVEINFFPGICPWKYNQVKCSLGFFDLMTLFICNAEHIVNWFAYLLYLDKL
jgi:hypothetical protein